MIFTARKRSLGQGNIFRSVCEEFSPQGGVCLSACWIPSPRDQAPPPPEPGTPHSWDQAPPPRRTRHPPGLGTPWAEHAGRYGQRAGDTHPTGMQSCRVYLQWQYFQMTIDLVSSLIMKMRKTRIITCSCNVVCTKYYRKLPMSWQQVSRIKWCRIMTLHLSTEMIFFFYHEGHLISLSFDRGAITSPQAQTFLHYANSLFKVFFTRDGFSPSPILY